MGLIGHQSSDLRNVPHPGTLLSGATSSGLAGLWIAPIGQFPVAVDGVLLVDGGLTGRAPVLEAMAGIEANSAGRDAT